MSRRRWPWPRRWAGWAPRPIDPLIAEYESTCPDPACRAFLLYALGKVKAPEIVKAAPLALEAAGSPDLELRDTPRAHRQVC